MLLLEIQNSSFYFLELNFDPSLFPETKNLPLDFLKLKIRATLLCFHSFLVFVHYSDQRLMRGNMLFWIPSIILIYYEPHV